jgi:hypothetical protein
VQKKAIYTWFHNHKNAFSTWSYAVLVKKNTAATPQQQQKNKANINQNPIHKPSCGSRKPKTPHKERKLKSQPKQTNPNPFLFYSK